MGWNETIPKYVKDAEEHPTMEELVEHFGLYDWTMPGVTAFLKALLTVNNHEILYDDKHDSWIYIAADTPELRKLIEESVPISDI